MWYVDDTDVPVVRASAVTNKMFDPQGRLRTEVLRQIRYEQRFRSEGLPQIRHEQRRERRRSWRPRFRIRIRFMLFSKTQRRLEALEHGRDALWSAPEALQKERDAFWRDIHAVRDMTNKMRGDIRKLEDEMLFMLDVVGTLKARVAVLEGNGCEPAQLDAEAAAGRQEPT